MAAPVSSSPVSLRDRFRRWRLRDPERAGAAWTQALVGDWRGMPTDANTLHHARLAKLAQLQAWGVSARAVNDWTLLQLALDSRSDLLIPALECGANPNARESNNHCDGLLHRAACHGNLALMEVLVRKGANKEMGDSMNYSPLWAALHGFSDRLAPEAKRWKAAQWLIEHGADIQDRPRRFASDRAPESIGRHALEHEGPETLAVLEALARRGWSGQVVDEEDPINKAVHPLVWFLTCAKSVAFWEQVFAWSASHFGTTLEDAREGDEVFLARLLRSHAVMNHRGNAQEWLPCLERHGMDWEELSLQERREIWVAWHHWMDRVAGWQELPSLDVASWLPALRAKPGMEAVLMGTSSSPGLYEEWCLVDPALAQSPVLAPLRAEQLAHALPEAGPATARIRF